MNNRKSSRKSKVKISITILTGCGLFFLFYAGNYSEQFSYMTNRQNNPQEILDHAVNSSGVKETKSIKKQDGDLIFEDHKSN